MDAGTKPTKTMVSRWRLVSAAGGVGLLLLIIRFGLDAGVTWDEPYQAEYGELVLRWFTSGFKDARAMSYENLFAYGGLFDVLAQVATRWSPIGLYETRHILTAFVGFAGIVTAGATAARVAGPRAGFFAGLFLALTPAWLGHSLFNPKDVPFGTAAILATYAAVRIATTPVPPTRASTLFAGAAIGIALGIRPGGVFLFAYPIIAVACSLLAGARTTPQSSSRVKERINATAIRFVPALVVAWTLMILAWPWAHVSPLERPIVAMIAASRFPWNGTTLFAGTTMKVSEVPVSYLPTWFAITTPEFYGVALLLGLLAVPHILRVAGAQALAGTLTIAAAIAVPIGAALVTRPALYDGVRHFLFVFPSLAALAGVLFSLFLSASYVPLMVRWAGAALTAVACTVTAWDIVALHPYEYVYFNRSFGGLPAAVGRYDTDYWGASYREGLAWIIQYHAIRTADGPINVASCDRFSNRRLEYYRNTWPGAAQAMRIVPEYAEADLFVAVTRYDCHKVPGETLHTVIRQGVPLVYVIRTTRSSHD